jgi:hypothetical protein
LEDVVLDERTVVKSPILPYVLMVASVLEGRIISRQELLSALLARMRQRSINKRARRDYVVGYLSQHPP